MICVDGVAIVLLHGSADSGTLQGARLTLSGFRIDSSMVLPTWITSLVEISATLLVASATFVWLVFAVMWLYYRLRRKGYSTARGGVWIGVAVLLWLVAIITMAGLADAGRLPLAGTNWEIWLSFAVGAPVTIAAVVTLLPRRVGRSEGARPTGYLFGRGMMWTERGLTAFGIVCLVAAAVMWFLPGESGITPLRLIKLGIGCLTMPALLAFYRRRAQAPTLEDAMQVDPRAPVLYLRAFQQEADAFIWGPTEYMAKFTSMPTETSWYTIGLTFEQYLKPAFEAVIGPMVALGNPEDVLPPEGAARLYAADVSWEEHFSTLARSAQVIVMEMSCSDNLRWELAEIRRRGWQTKLFVIVPPVPLSNRAAYRWLYAFWRASKGLPLPRWSRFAQQLRRVGYEPGTDAPGPGSVIGFDASGESRELNSGCQLPEDFVAAVGRGLPA